MTPDETRQIREECCWTIDASVVVLIDILENFL